MLKEKVDSPSVIQFEIGPMQNFVYLILDHESRKAAVVDPQKNLSEPLGAISSQGYTLSLVLLTHSHHDHIAGVPELVKTHPEVPIILHEEEVHRLDRGSRQNGKLQLVRDGDEIGLGNSVIRVLHTPGHSSGECSYLLEGIPPQLFTGDTVFIRDCGRTDLPTGSTSEMFETLQRLKKLAPETVILPGHHYKPEFKSTLERELRESPPFQCKNVEELAALP